MTGASPAPLKCIVCRNQLGPSENADDDSADLGKVLRPCVANKPPSDVGAPGLGVRQASEGLESLLQTVDSELATAITN